MTTITYQVKTKKHGMVKVEWTFQCDTDADKFQKKCRKDPERKWLRRKEK